MPAPASRLAPAAPPAGRLPPPCGCANALGQSLPDWLRLRYGRIDTAPDGVAFPESGAEVRELLDYAAAHWRLGDSLRRRHQRGRPPDPAGRRAPVLRST